MTNKLIFPTKTNSVLNEQLVTFIINSYPKLSVIKISKILSISTSTIVKVLKLNNIKLKQYNKWDFNKIHYEALKYSSKVEFCKLNSRAYYSAIRLNILNQVCSHMSIQGHLYKRFVYIYQFSDNSIYVGITCNKKRRHKAHKISGILKNRTFIKYKVSKLLPTQDALKLEQKMVDLFRINGYNVLNKNKCFSLGSVKEIWTKDACIKEALKYDTKSQWERCSSSSYSKAILNKWVDECSKHMPFDVKIKKVKNINTGEIFESTKHASIKYNIKNIRSAIYKKHKCGGFYWEYVK